MSIKEFIVNDFLTLRLEYGITNIYLKGKLFRQCKFLLLNKLHADEIEEFLGEFSSVDEEIEKFDRSLEQEESNGKIPPETEFWAHCSNLQVWAENEYDTRLLHSNLAFPLLKKLSDEGDLIAKRSFKEEIAKRIESGVPSVINFLKENEYLQYLSKEELFYAILEPEDAEVLLELEQSSPYNYGWIENFEVLRSIGHDGYDVHFAVNKRKIVEIESFFETTGPALFPKALSNLTNLKTLYILINEFVDYLPKPKIEMSSIEELRIFSWGESALPDSFDKFPNLKRLFIYGGFSEKTLESISSLKNLKILVINETELRHLPESIENLKFLEILDLRRCNLWDLPKSIIKLTNIKKLEINSELLDENIEKWVKSLNLVQTSIYTTSKYKYLILGKKNN